MLMSNLCHYAIAYWNKNLIFESPYT
uniref:Uncharacterized protein n=1 Tax=Anguilla anguilla TaxID=7936 RepID=A0A0E9S5Z9_ANGAN